MGGGGQTLVGNVPQFFFYGFPYYLEIMDVHDSAQISSTLTNDQSRITLGKSKRLAEVHLGLICNTVCMNVCII